MKLSEISLIVIVIMASCISFLGIISSGELIIVWMLFWGFWGLMRKGE